MSPRCVEFLSNDDFTNAPPFTNKVMKNLDYKKIYMESFGKRVLLARKTKKLNQEMVAEMLGEGWTQTSYKNVEKGRRMPRKNNLEKLASILGVTEEWLIYGEDDPVIIENTDYGRNIEIKHTKNHKTSRKIATKSIKENLKMLSDDNIHIVHKLCEELAREQNDEDMMEYLRQKENKFKSDLAEAKKK